MAFFSHASLFGARAVKPHTYEDLKNYGARVEFDATVQLSYECSASRITIDQDDPFEFYITAAHCLDYDYTGDDGLGSFLALLSSNFKKDDRKTETFLQRFFSEHETDEYGDQDHLLSLSNDLIHAVSSGDLDNIPASSAELEAFFDALYEKNSLPHDRYNLSRIKYIMHPLWVEGLSLPDYDSATGNAFYNESTGTVHNGPATLVAPDLALFTLYQKPSQKPAYQLYRDNIHALVGRDLVSVGFGARTDIENMIQVIARQAFDTKISEIWFTGNYIQFISGNFTNDGDMDPSFIRGIVTGGDSGGSLLLKKDGLFLLAGVVAAASDARDYACWNALDLEFIRQAKSKLLADWKNSKKDEL